MHNQLGSYSPQRDARITGLLYAVIMVGGYYAEGTVRSSLIVGGDPAATAHNILASEFLYRTAIVVQLGVLICDTAVAILLFNILEPVNRILSGLTTASRLVFVGILASGSIFNFAALYVLDGSGHLGSISAPDAQALAMLALRLYTKAFQIGLIFFGVNIALMGVLIIHSRFLPSLLGLLLLLAGVGYLTFAFLSLLAPVIADDIGTYLLVLGFVAELSLTVWLLIRGLNQKRWLELAEGKH